ncbi:hypothetical protein TanjilG_24899 [Lupinus angustifolius]|uniref:U1-type domain-containing protein n=1 Tax=Lupinus angustifolius TaxID=3871 RepID=A0A4P1R0H4_LUPAN|nr:PREDICTED: uncharacterized protein LOC109325874 [Lupinus angustifolius]OIV98728.1 hypothetical protein TanjilG_24899 [Lupinus angustifolius]
MDSSNSQQQQQHHHHEYDPSQMQAYDPSSQQYYHHHHHDYNNNNNNNNQQQNQYYQDQILVHPPGVAIAPEPDHSAGSSQTQQLNPVQGASDAGLLNPGVVVGNLTQLSQYAGNVDGVLPVMYEQIGPSQYRGRGHRGGRRGGRGHFNHRGRAPYRGGRGRVVGDGRHFPSNVAEAPAAEGTSVVQPESLISGQVSLPDPTQAPTAKLQLPPAKLWCEICKAECNSPEMLQQHINGKRHKKNFLVHEELQRRKAVNGQLSGQISTSELNLTIQPESVQESKTDNPKDETELQNIVGGTSEVLAEAPVGEPDNNSAGRGRGGLKNKRRGRGSKYMRSNDGSRIAVEPKQAISFICELCNVKCESQVVYNSHMIGKKHMSNFKRVHGHQAVNLEAAAQHNPPNANDLSNSNNSLVHQGVSDPQLLLAQLLMTVQSVLSQVQVPAVALPSGPVAGQIQTVAGSSHDHLQNLSQTQVSGSTAHVDSENLNGVGETKIQPLSAPPELNATIAGLSNDTQTTDGRSETEKKVL